MGGIWQCVLASFQRRLHGAKYARNDLKYFPLWVRRYAESVTEEEGRFPVSGELVLGFSMSLRQSGTPAWPRLQAVQAVEAYRDLVLRRGELSLGEVRQALQRLAEREREGPDPGPAQRHPPDAGRVHARGIGRPDRGDRGVASTAECENGRG